jgi:hypothetical protein
MGRFLSALGLIVVLSQAALGESGNPRASETQWQGISTSLTNLLDDGWKVVGQSSHRAVTITRGDVEAVDSTTIVYTLSKDGKYVTCLLNDPRVNSLTYSACRTLN